MKRRLPLILLIIFLLLIGVVQYLRYTPHGWLTWRAALILKADDLFFKNSKAPEANPAALKALRQDLYNSLPLLSPGRVAGVGIDDTSIPGTAGQIPVRVYRRENSEDSEDGAETKKPALLVYYHGGGWVVGDIGTHDHVCALITKRSGAIVVSVDYRLAPEHPFPAALDDAYVALQWVRTNAATLGADPKRIFVGGDSAGGNLSAAVAILDRDKLLQGAAFPELKGQILIYPAVDISGKVYQSHKNFAKGYLLTREKLNWYIERYVPEAPLRKTQQASPLLAKDHAGLAPALIITAGFDVLRDEGRAYAKKLKDAGVSVKYREYPGVIHGFLNMYNLLPESSRALNEIAAELQAQ